MKYEFWRALGFSILVSIVFVAGYSHVAAQPAQTTCKQKKADKLLEQGQAALAKNDYQQAVSFFEQAATAAPKCPVPYFHKGNALTDFKKYDESVVAYQEGLKRNYAEPFRLH